jgi:hypothetical protein
MFARIFTWLFHMPYHSKRIVIVGKGWRDEWLIVVWPSAAWIPWRHPFPLIPREAEGAKKDVLLLFSSSSSIPMGRRRSGAPLPMDWRSLLLKAQDVWRYGCPSSLVAQSDPGWDLWHWHSRSVIASRVEKKWGRPWKRISGSDR